jgi:hypothetical protein
VLKLLRAYLPVGTGSPVNAFFKQNDLAALNVVSRESWNREYDRLLRNLQLTTGR